MLGQALDEALGDRAGIYRYGEAIVPMDEARAMCAIDVSGRPYLRMRPSCRRARPAASTTSCSRSSSAPLANNAKLTVHLEIQAAGNAHHMIEAAFKAFARALRGAVAIDPTEHGVPSTKGVL